MAKPRVTDDQLAAEIEAGHPASVILSNVGLRSWGNYDRLQRVAKERGLTIAKAYQNKVSPAETDLTRKIREHLNPNGRRHIRCENGTVLVFSDSHYWPGIISTAHRAFVRFCADMRPSHVINNGDSIDGATISRYARIGWDNRPKLRDELEACTARLVEIEDAARTKNLYWNLGNHDGRFETFLASRVPEHEGITGFHLKDHFSAWLPSWSVWINESVVVKHRMKGGIHATRANAVNAGKTVVTGHLHSLKVTPLTDYNGTRWGVDTGTLAQVNGPQFTDYTEDNPCDWRAGFAVLTFWRGQLLPPELVQVIDEEAGLVTFRGEVIHV